MLSLPQLQRHDSGGIFFFLFKKVKKFGTPAGFPRIVGVVDSPPKAPYIEDEIWKSSLRTKLQEGMSSEINFA